MADSRAISELIEKMTVEREKLLAQIEALGNEEAEHAPSDAQGEGQWSPKQQCAHLAEMESAYRAWVKLAIAEDDPDVTNVRGEPVAIALEQANGSSIAALAAELRRQRELTLRFIDGLQPEDYERKASQPMFGSLTVLQWLRSYYRHDRMHQAQIAGRESPFKPNYVRGREPDQRRTRIQ